MSDAAPCRDGSGGFEVQETSLPRFKRGIRPHSMHERVVRGDRPKLRVEPSCGGRDGEPWSVQ